MDPRRVLVPHAEEEQTTYRAAGELSEGRLLIASRLAEHVLIRRIASLLVAARDAVEAGAYGRVLFEIFHSHQRKENEMILPLLVAEDTVSLTEVMSRHPCPRLRPRARNPIGDRARGQPAACIRGG